MDELIVPATPQWFRPNIFVCAPDNTLVYGAKNDIVVLRKTPGGPADVRTIAAAHSRFILTVGLNKKWGEPNKYAVSVGEDNVIRVWNLETLEKKSSNNVFGEQKHTAVGAVFAGEDRIVSVTENGVVLIWNIVLNESKVMSELLRINKNQVTCLSSCPHAGHLTAFGLTDGCIVVADLRREGHVMYKMRGHERPVTSLSWCPVPINIFPKRPHNTVGLEKVGHSESPAAKVETVDAISAVVDQQETKVEPVDQVGAESIDQQDNKVDSVDQQDNNVESEAELDSSEKHESTDRSVEEPETVEKSESVVEKSESFVEKSESVVEKSENVIEKCENVVEKSESVVEKSESVIEKSESETKLTSSTDEPESSELEEQKQGAIRKTEKRTFLRAKKKKPRRRPDAAGDAPPAVAVKVNDFLAECNSVRDRILGINQPTTMRTVVEQPNAERGDGEEKRDLLPENPCKDDSAGENEPHRVQNRELPHIFDHSCDFFDNVAEETLDMSRRVPHGPKVVVVEVENKTVEDFIRDYVSKEKSAEDGESKEKSAEDYETKEKSAEDDETKEKGVEDHGSKEKIVEDDESKEKVARDDEPKEKNVTDGSVEKRHAERKSDGKDNRDAGRERRDKDRRRRNSDHNRRERRKSRDETGDEKEKVRERRKSRDENGDDKEKPRSIVESVEEEPRHEYLLASASRDRKVYIWRGGTDGRMQTFFPVPRRSSRSEPLTNSNYISICWASPTELLVSTLHGEIYSMKLPRSFSVSSKHEALIHKKHFNCTVFNIVTPMKYFTASNWQDKTNLQIWSHDQKSVVYYDAAEGVSLDLNSITAHITCFASSPLDPNRVAVGVRDCFIHTWDLSKIRNAKNRMPKHSKKIRGKVSALCWHPTREVMLGFGTDEGAVGIVESNKQDDPRDRHGYGNNKTTTFQANFRSEVFKVEWGPITGNKTYLGLYAVAEGKLVIYDVAQSKRVDPINVQMPDKNMYLYKFAWKPDYSCLLLSMKDGSLVVLNTNLQVVSIIYLDDKPVTHIAWHPEAAEGDAEEFKFCNWVALATAKGVILYDCSLALQKDATNEQFLENKRGFLDGHLKPVTGLAWSPFKSNLLVTTSSDGLIHVWDVLTKTVISTYVDQFFSIISSVLWSPSNPDLVIIGGKQVVIWNITKHSPKVDAEFMAEHKKAMQKALTHKPETKDKNPAALPKTVVLTGEDQDQVEIPKTIKLSKKSIVPTIYTASDDNAGLQVANMRKLMDGTSFDGQDPMNLFGSQTDVMDLLQANRELHRKDYKTQYSDMIALFKGDVAACVKEAIQDNRVTPFIISMAPMVSTKCWQEACELYAKTLSEEASPNFLLAASYYLMCHKIEQAVNCLCDGSLHREALALAKCRFPKDNPIVHEVTEKWAKDCFDQGNYELTAYCYISIGEYGEAARALAKRNKPEVLEFALELATKAESAHLSAMITSKLNEIRNARDVEIKSSRLEALLDKDCATGEQQTQSNSITTAICVDVVVQSSPEKDSELAHKDSKDVSIKSETSGIESGDSHSPPDSSVCHDSFVEEV